jgi:hypothetical protein
MYDSSKNYLVNLSTPNILNGLAQILIFAPKEKYFRICADI